MIYVDGLREYPQRPFGHRQWCHLWTDGELEELHAFAEGIGLRRVWFQNHRLLPHYDLTAGRRAAAIGAGAVVGDLGARVGRDRRELAGGVSPK